MTRSIQELAQEALAIQDASNLSAIVKTFQQALEALWQHALADGRGTDFVNQHPITRAYVSKLVSLSSHERCDGTFAQVIRLAGAALPAASI